MSIEVTICNRCGEPCEPEDMEDGICFACLDHKPIDFETIYVEIDKDDIYT
jgi:formylmethanofuran dehydrogenase subunit E